MRPGHRRGPKPLIKHHAKRQAKPPAKPSRPGAALSVSLAAMTVTSLPVARLLPRRSLSVKPLTMAGCACPSS